MEKEVREKMNITLTPLAKELIEEISIKRGISKSAIIEQFIRQEAERLDIKGKENK
jgi:hypothetical protein